MPTYRYECSNDDCPRGQFDIVQSMKDDALTKCPFCGESVERIITAVQVSTPRSDTDIRDKGFAKLVKRDDGVYENVTALDGESRYWHADKPETMPDIKRRVSD